MAGSVMIYGNLEDLFSKLTQVLTPSHEVTESYEHGDADYECDYVHNAPIAKHNLFIIKALAYKGAVKQSQEAVQRQKEFEAFEKKVEDYVKEHLDIDHDHLHIEPVEVDGYSKMKMKFKKYLEGTPEDHNPSNIIAVFLGHGSILQDYAILCFADGECPLVNNAFNELHEIHAKSGVKSNLNIVFSQCYSHKCGIETKGDAEPALYCEPSGSCDTKFMFLSSDKKVTTTSQLRLETLPKKSLPIAIGHDLFVDHKVSPDILSQFRQNLNEYILNKFQKQITAKECYNWFEFGTVPKQFKGNQQCVTDIREKISSLKKEIKSYLHLEIGMPVFSTKAAASVKEHQRNDGYPFESDKVNSYGDLKKSMEKFVNCGAQIPIIFISGYCKKVPVNDSAEKHKLVFSNNECISIENILKITNASPDVRVTFFCEDLAEDVVDSKTPTNVHVSIYSESVAKLQTAKHLELENAIFEIIKVIFH